MATVEPFFYRRLRDDVTAHPETDNRDLPIADLGADRFLPYAKSSSQIGWRDKKRIIFRMVGSLLAVPFGPATRRAEFFTQATGKQIRAELTVSFRRLDRHKA